MIHQKKSRTFSLIALFLFFASISFSQTKELISGRLEFIYEKDPKNKDHYILTISTFNDILLHGNFHEISPLLGLCEAKLNFTFRLGKTFYELKRFGNLKRSDVFLHYGGDIYSRNNKLVISFMAKADVAVLKSNSYSACIQDAIYATNRCSLKSLELPDIMYSIINIRSARKLSRRMTKDHNLEKVNISSFKLTPCY